MDDAGAVEQHIHRADFICRGSDVLGAGDVEPARKDSRRGGDFPQLLFVDVGRPHLRPLSRERKRGAVPDTLRRRGDKGRLARQSLSHGHPLWKSSVTSPNFPP